MSCSCPLPVRTVSTPPAACKPATPGSDAWQQGSQKLMLAVRGILVHPSKAVILTGLRQMPKLL